MVSHTLSKFDQDLNLIKTEVNTLATIVLEEYVKALDVFNNPDRKMAKQIVKQDKKANECLKNIELHSIRILARQNAVADDLRFILCSMRMAPRLERIGDYAKGMATRAANFKEGIPEELMTKFHQMHLHMMTMLTSVIESYNNQNLAQTLMVKEGDDDLDEQYDEVYTLLLENLMTQGNHPEQQVDLLFIAKGLERAGDHITDIARDVRFMIKGIKPRKSEPPKALSDD